MKIPIYMDNERKELMFKKLFNINSGSLKYQLNIFIEEISELLLEIVRYRRKRSTSNLISEIVDLYIILEEFIYVLKTYGDHKIISNYKFQFIKIFKMLDYTPKIEYNVYSGNDSMIYSFYRIIITLSNFITYFELMYKELDSISKCQIDNDVTNIMIPIIQDKKIEIKLKLILKFWKNFIEDNNYQDLFYTEYRYKLERLENRINLQKYL